MLDLSNSKNSYTFQALKLARLLLLKTPLTVLCFRLQDEHNYYVFLCDCDVQKA